MPEFQIDDEKFQELISTQILASLSEDSKTSLVKEAMTFLTTKQKRAFSHVEDPSPLMQAFENEMRSVARKIAQEVLSEEVIRTEVEKTLREILLQTVNDRSFDFAVIISHAIRENLEIAFKDSNT